MAVRVAIYVLRQLWSHTTEQETWPHKLFSFVQRNMLGLAIILIPILLVGSVAVLFWRILPSEPNSTESAEMVTPASEQSPIPIETLEITSTPQPIQESLSFSVSIAGTVLTPFTPVPMEETTHTQVPNETQTPTPWELISLLMLARLIIMTSRMDCLFVLN